MSVAAARMNLERGFLGKLAAQCRLRRYNYSDKIVFVKQNNEKHSTGLHEPNKLHWDVVSNYQDANKFRLMVLNYNLMA